MPLITTEVLERAREILDEKTGDGGCSFCGHEKRTLHPNIFSFPDVTVPTLPALGILDKTGVVFIDLMFTTCDNCGHVDFFNAHQLGVLKGGCTVERRWNEETKQCEVEIISAIRLTKAELEEFKKDIPEGVRIISETSVQSPGVSKLTGISSYKKPKVHIPIIWDG